MAAPLSSDTTVQTVFEPNPVRVAYIVQNTDTNRAYILHGEGTVSATNFTYFLDEGDNAQPIGWTGKVTVIWAGDGSGILTRSESRR